MYKLTLALAAFAFVAAAGGARADNSGHIGINSLTAQMPRDFGPLAPVSDAYIHPARRLVRSPAVA